MIRHNVELQLWQVLLQVSLCHHLRTLNRKNAFQTYHRILMPGSTFVLQSFFCKTGKQLKHPPVRVDLCMTENDGKTP